MAPLLEDPRIRQTWNQISHNAEHATETAAEGLWTFSHAYISPCLSGIGESLRACTAPCFPGRDERARRARERRRGEAELSFDFYDDWDDEFGGGITGNIGGGGSSRAGLLGWGNSEWDRLLAGSGAHGGEDRQPGRKRGMSYGTRGRGPRRKSTVDTVDPTVIPSSNALGFLGRLPFKLGGTLRYKPSAAHLQEHPGTLRSEFMVDEQEPLMEGEDESEGETYRGHARKRSSTNSSGDTTDSFRSRGDLFPSDGEDDAVPLDDEFALALERRNTNQMSVEDHHSAKTRYSKGKKRAASSLYSRNTQSSSQTRQARAGSTPEPASPSPGISNMTEVPSMLDLREEEERVQREEDEELERKREAAYRLARERGLSLNDQALPLPVPAGISNTKTVHVAQDEDLPDLERRAPDVSSSQLPKEIPKGKEFVPARLPFF